MRQTIKHVLQPIWDRHIELVLERYGAAMRQENEDLRIKNEQLERDLTTAKKQLSEESPKPLRHFIQMKCTVNGCDNIRYQGGICLEHKMTEQLRGGTLETSDGQ